MNCFPQVNIPYDPELNFKSYLYYRMDLDHESYDSLCKIISYYVGEDCWGVSVDNEVLFNSYLTFKNKSVKKYMNDTLIRDLIINDPHSNLLLPIMRKNQDSRIRIYMFGSNCWTINILYKHIYKVYQISFYQSKELYDYNM